MPWLEGQKLPKFETLSPYIYPEAIDPAKPTLEISHVSSKNADLSPIFFSWVLILSLYVSCGKIGSSPSLRYAMGRVRILFYLALPSPFIQKSWRLKNSGHFPYNVDLGTWKNSMVPSLIIFQIIFSSFSSFRMQMFPKVLSYSTIQPRYRKFKTIHRYLFQSTYYTKFLQKRRFFDGI